MSCGKIAPGARLTLKEPNMILNETDLKLFYKLHPALLLYTNQQFQTAPEIIDWPSLFHSELALKKEIRDKLYDEPDLFDDFISENPFRFDRKELNIVSDWRKFVRGAFFVFKHYKKYSAFVESGKPGQLSGKVYGVLGLTEPLDIIIPRTPAYVDAVLLPFKDRIIYDGIIEPYSISFGREVRYTLKRGYDLAKATYGIVEKLPFNAPAKSEASERLLKFYLKNADEYQEQIDELIAEDASVRQVYFQELGKKNARLHKKKLKEYGIGESWFVFLGEAVIASGKTREEAKTSAHGIVPKEQRNLLYYFHMK